VIIFLLPELFFFVHYGKLLVNVSSDGIFFVLTKCNAAGGQTSGRSKTG
jgi:hypothetical protein